MVIGMDEMLLGHLIKTAYHQASLYLIRINSYSWTLVTQSKVSYLTVVEQRLEDDATAIRLHPTDSLEDHLIYLPIHIVSAALGVAIYYAVTLGD